MRYLRGFRHRVLRLYHSLVLLIALFLLSLHSNYYYYYYYYYCNRNIFFVIIITLRGRLLFTNRSRVRCPTAGRRGALNAVATSRPLCIFFLLSVLLSSDARFSLVTRRLRGATSANGGTQRDGGISPLPACLSLYRFFHFYIVIDIS